MAQLAVGSYHGKVVGGTTIEAGGNKTPMMEVECELRYVWEGGKWTELPSPERRKLKLFLSDKAWPYSQKKLVFLCFNGDFANPQFSGPAVDEGVALTCSHKKSDDRTKTYEEWDLSEWGGGSQRAGEETMHMLNALWKQVGGGYKETPAAPPTAPPVDDSGAEEPPF